MHFQILNTVTGLYLGDHTGPYRYPDGREAAQAANDFSTYFGQKCQPRRVEDEVDWRARERARFEDGTYVMVPWIAHHWFTSKVNPDHFVHLSRSEPGKVAFTENEEKGIADRQTRMRGGAYLKKFFSDVLSDDEITELATAMAGELEANEVRFATTPDDIERVYLNGPTSCMSHSLDEYSCSVHPVRVYGAGDCAVAYLERRDHVTARSVCWPEKKIYTRIYGDEIRLEPLLKKLGYRKGSLNRARLLKIEDRPGRYVCPYVDSCDEVMVEQDFLRLCDSGGDYATDATCGYVGEEPEPYATCSHCDAAIETEEDAYTVCIGRNTDRTWCEHCRENEAVYCEGEGDVLYSRTVTMADGTSWSDWNFEDNGFTCAHNGKNYPDSEICTVTFKDGSTETWSLEACEADAVLCRVTGEWYLPDAVVKLKDSGHLVGFDTDAAREAIDAGNAELPDGNGGFRMLSPTIHDVNQLDLLMQPAE